MSRSKLSEKQNMEKKKENNSERIAITCGDAGENHAGMELLGELGEKGSGFTINDLDRAKAQLSSGFIRAQDFTFSRLERNVKSLFNHSKMFSEDYILKKISELKISNLLDLYDRLFHDPKTVLSIIGPDQKDFSNLNL